MKYSLEALIRPQSGANNDRVRPSNNDLNPVTKLTKPVCLTDLTCAS